MFVSLNNIRNSRVSGHGIRIVLYAHIRLLTVIVLLKYITWSIYTETDVPLISQCFISRGLVRQQVQWLFIGAVIIHWRHLKMEPYPYSLRNYFNRTIKTQRKYKTSVIGTPFKLPSQLRSKRSSKLVYKSRYGL